MKKIITLIVLLACASLAFSATVTPSVKGQARVEQGPGFLMSSWHMDNVIVTYARNDTVVFTRDIDMWFNSESAASFMGAWTTNNTGADSGDVSCKLEVGWDSSCYYTTVLDSVRERQVGVAADTFTVGQQGVYRFYDGYGYNRIVNDSTLTYSLFTVQPKAASGGYKLALPLQWPRFDNIILPFTRFRLVFSKGSKFKSGDTTWVKNAAIITKDWYK